MRTLDILRRELACDCGISYRALIYWTAVTCGSCGRIYERTGPIWYLRSVAKDDALSADFTSNYIEMAGER